MLLFTLQIDHVSVQVVQLLGDQCLLALSSSRHNIYRDMERPPEMTIAKNSHIKSICTCPWKDGTILSLLNNVIAVLAMSWLESCPLIPSVTFCDIKQPAML